VSLTAANSKRKRSVDLLAALRSFTWVSETGSFSAVAVERGVTQPAISRQLSGLEEYLGVRLVNRSTRSVKLTDEGRKFLPSAHDIVNSANAMLDAAKQRRGTPVGLVRIAVSIPLGIHLGRQLASFFEKYDGLSIELVLRDHYGDLMEDGLDAEVRVGPRSDSSLISRRVGSTSQWLIAAPGYLAGKPQITHPRELIDHSCLVHHREGSDDVWWFADPASGEEIDVRVSGRFSANNAAAIHSAALGGLGIACLSHLIVKDDVQTGRLRRLLPDYRPRRYPIYIDYPSRRTLPPRVKTVIDYLHDIAKDDPLFWP